ncbi:MAG: sensor histidine kinase [Crocinitomicaceae bacterium]|nr:sensor histidine kinase [Crocinitomicaceae bacterium]
MKPKILLLLAFLLALPAYSQIFRGVKSLEAYTADLELLDGYVKSNPKEFDIQYEKLWNTFESNHDKTLETILYIYQGSKLYYFNDLDSAAYYFDLATERATQIGSDQLYRTAEIRRIFCDEYKKTKYQMAKEMESIYVDSYNKRDTINMLYSLNGLGIFYGDMDSVSISLKIYYEALKLAELTQNKYETGFILNNLGLIKFNLGAADSAYSDFKRCMELGIELGNISLEGIGRQNLGLYYNSIDSTQWAKEEYLKVMEIGKQSGYSLYTLSSTTNLASLEMQLGNAKTSDSLSNVALQIAKEDGIYFTIPNIYLGKAYFMLRNGKYDEGLRMLDSAEAYSKYGTYSEVMPPLYHLKYRLYEEKGDYENALETYKFKVAVQDSLDEVGNAKLLAELQFRYDDEKKERIRSIEKNKLKLQLKQSEVDMANYRQNVIIVISIFLVIIFVIVILYFRLKQKSDNLFSFTIANKLEEERGRIARDLHDGLGQSMIVLKNKFNNLRLEDKKAQELNDNFSEVIEEVRTISRSLIPPELRRLGLNKSIQNMMQDIERNVGFIVTTDLDILEEITFEEHQSIRIYRIIQELCNNTIKHSGASSIKLEAELIDGHVLFTYRDNGIGLDMDKWRAGNNSVGFKSIQQRLKYLDGTIRVDKPKNGFKVEIKIPIPRQ